MNPISIILESTGNSVWWFFYQRCLHLEVRSWEFGIQNATLALIVVRIEFFLRIRWGLDVNGKLPRWNQYITVPGVYASLRDRAVLILLTFHFRRLWEWLCSHHSSSLRRISACLFALPDTQSSRTKRQTKQHTTSFKSDWLNSRHCVRTCFSIG